MRAFLSARPGPADCGPMILALFAAFLSAALDEPVPEPAQSIPGPCQVIAVQSPTRVRVQCDRAWTAIPVAGYAPQVGDAVTLVISAGRVYASRAPGQDGGVAD